jgi:hypothetical protein
MQLDIPLSLPRLFGCRKIRRRDARLQFGVQTIRTRMAPAIAPASVRLRHRIGVFRCDRNVTCIGSQRVDMRWNRIALAKIFLHRQDPICFNNHSFHAFRLTAPWTRHSTAIGFCFAKIVLPGAGGVLMLKSRRATTRNAQDLTIAAQRRIKSEGKLPP